MLRELTIHEMSFVSGAEGTEFCSDSQEYSGGASYSSYDGSSNVDVGWIGKLVRLPKDIFKNYLGSLAYDSFKDTPITGNPGYPGNAANGYGSFQKNDDYDGVFGGNINHSFGPFSDPAS